MTSSDGEANDDKLEDDGGAGAWDVWGTITPGDAVGSVTERVLNVCGAWVVIFVVVIELVGTINELELNGVVVATAGTLLAIPRILSAVFMSKQPTYMPAVPFMGTAKHESPGAQVVSL